jgi:sugar phosphate isomerase/epimerase
MTTACAAATAASTTSPTYGSGDSPDSWQLTLLGHGEVPVRPMLDLLTAGGYQGWISVEWEKHWHPEIEDPELALPQHLELLNAWLRPTAKAPQAPPG